PSSDQQSRKWHSRRCGNVVSPAAGFNISQAQGSPRDVNGIVGGSVLLSLIIPQGQSILEVRWKSVTNNARLGDFKSKTFEPFHLANPTITQRLEMVNATILRITNLAKNDRGIYRAEVQYESGFNEEKEFQLKVYDPVPDLHIEKEALSTTNDGCNVTLVCRIASGHDFNFLWLKRDTRESTRYQNISDGQTLRLSLSTNQMDAEYFCLVSNPAEHKNTSTSHVCPRDNLLIRSLPLCCTYSNSINIALSTPDEVLKPFTGQHSAPVTLC
ncbi:CD48 antigen-like, partial [Lissotriton helveticus]